MVESFPDRAPKTFSRRDVLRLFGLSFVGGGAITLLNSESRLKAYDDQAQEEAERVCFKMIAVGTSSEDIKELVKKHPTLRQCLSMMREIHEKDTAIIRNMYQGVRCLGVGLVGVGLVNILISAIKPKDA